MSCWLTGGIKHRRRKRLAGDRSALLDGHSVLLMTHGPA
jgi:hypothetical protein